MAIIFINLVLHFFSVSTVKNGIRMLKFAVYHPEEFDSPT
jgi:hypothetical protein